MAFELPTLPYSHSALAGKGMCQETLELHHGKHHQAYVTALNGFVEKDPALQGKSLEEIVKLSYNDAAKAGVNAMTVGLAHAFGPKVRVNAIMPGPFLTSIAVGWDMERFGEQARTFPLRRAGDANEIVGAALYLAGDASTYTTGTVLTVDGGAQWSMAGTGEEVAR